MATAQVVTKTSPSVNKQFAKTEWVYVTVPEKDALDGTHPGIGLNHDHYGPGTHLVPPDVAATITERLQAYDHSVMRLLRPQADKVALRDVNRGSILTTPSGEVLKSTAA